MVVKGPQGPAGGIGIDSVLADILRHLQSARLKQDIEDALAMNSRLTIVLSLEKNCEVSMKVTWSS